MTKLYLKKLIDFTGNNKLSSGKQELKKHFQLLQNKFNSVNGYTPQDLLTITKFVKESFQQTKYADTTKNKNIFLKFSLLELFLKAQTISSPELSVPINALGFENANRLITILKNIGFPDFDLFFNDYEQKIVFEFFSGGLINVSSKETNELTTEKIKQLLKTDKKAPPAFNIFKKDPEFAHAYLTVKIYEFLENNKPWLVVCLADLILKNYAELLSAADKKHYKDLKESNLKRIP